MDRTGEQGGRGANFQHSSGEYQGGCHDDCTPVIADMAGNGFSLTSLANGVYFDMNGDGVKEKVSWTAMGSDDAWLALDRNGNGIIDNGTELFGNFTPQPPPPDGIEKNGFNALARFDLVEYGGNGDGAMTEGDPIFPRLLLWQDINHNGISESTEIRKLKDSNIDLIDLKYKVSRYVDEFGNEFRYRTKVKAKGEKTGKWMFDVFLVAQH